MLVGLDKKYPGIRKIITKPFVKDINPDIITYLSLVVAVAAGFLFYKNSILIASLLVAISTYFDVLDGAIAKTFRKTKLGDFLDHTFDRISDSAIFIGIALNPTFNTLFVLLALISVLLVSYLGTQAQALTKDRLYAGILGRADRCAILIFAGLLSYFHTDLLWYGIIIIFILSIVTFMQRYYAIYKNLLGKHKA